MNLRGIARLLGVVNQSVADWIAAHAAGLPTDPADRPLPDAAGDGTVEVDELATFIGKKLPNQRHRGGRPRHAADRRAAGDVGG